MHSTLKKVQKWQTETLGSSMTATGAAHHLLQEANEILSAVTECDGKPTPAQLEHIVEETADVMFMVAELLMLLGTTTGNLETQIIRKLEKNKKRKWEAPDENGVINHVVTGQLELPVEDK